MNMQEVPQLLTAKEFARRRGDMNLQTLARWRREGLLDAVQNGSIWLYRAEDITKPISPEMTSRTKAKLKSQEGA